MVWGLLNQIGQDSGWFWVAFLMVKLLPLVFAVLTALWITHMARAVASKNSERPDEGLPPS
jgi:predicted outer membrane lipoprotein